MFVAALALVFASSGYPQSFIAEAVAPPREPTRHPTSRPTSMILPRLRFVLLGLMSIALVALTVPGLASAKSRCGNHPWCDTKLSPDARARLLLGAMTPQERIAMLAGDDASGVITAGEHDHTGGSQTVRFGLSDRAFAHWDTARNGWRVARGSYQVWVGFSSRDVRQAGTVGVPRSFATR